jgi:hypothetical protein
MCPCMLCLCPCPMARVLLPCRDSLGRLGRGPFVSACYYIMRALALLAAALPSPALSRVASLPLPLVADRQLGDSVVAWSRGRVVAWSRGRVVAWSRGRVVAWSRGRPSRGRPSRGRPSRGRPSRGRPSRGRPCRGRHAALRDGRRTRSVGLGCVQKAPASRATRRSKLHTTRRRCRPRPGVPRRTKAALCIYCACRLVSKKTEWTGGRLFVTLASL